jgi:glycosyltransferase involved in cell wall biosynthesis
MPSDSDNGVSTIQEAMAMGRAVISTATAGRAELLEDDVNCLLVPERDPDALRAAIERLWNDPELCARLGVNGRERVRTGYDVEVWISTIRAAAVEAAAGRPR